MKEEFTMKKNIIFAVAAASTLLLSFSCTKQDETPARNFTATINQALTKTTLSELQSLGEKEGYFIYWDNDDRVNINGSNYYAVPSEKDKTSATLKYIDGPVPNSPYKAVFPATLYDDESGKYKFPRVQEYEKGRFNAPMAAVSKDEKLYFRSICGVICFTLTGTGTVKQIQITSEQSPLSGPFELDEDGRVKMTASPGFDYITLDCDDGVHLSGDPQKFYVYLPGDKEYHDLDIRVFDFNGKWSCYEKQQTIKPLPVNSGFLYDIVWEGIEFENKPEYDPHYDNR